MRKLTLGEWITLDGYVTDRNGELDYFTKLTPEQNKEADTDMLRFMDSIDTILLGRKTYELFVEFWPNASSETEIIADRLNATKKMVFSNTLKQAPWGKWADCEITGGDAVEAVHQLKTQPGKNIVVWGSISLAQSLMKAGLIDEYSMYVCPVLTAGGRKLFTEDMNPANLKLEEEKRYDASKIVLLRYTSD